MPPLFYADTNPDRTNRIRNVNIVLGYWWKKLFVPAGSLARMTYKGKAFVAEVVAGGFRYDGKVISPSEFVFEVTRTSRNAWRDIEFKFADSSSWVLADDLRRHLETRGS